MKKMTKLISMIMIATIFMVQSGCVSYLASESKKEDIRMERALSTGDDAIIATAKSGGDLKEFGIDPTYGDTFKKHPIVMSLAAIADVLLVGGGAKVLSDELSDDSNSSSSSDESRRDTTDISITGDSNVVQVSGDTTTTNTTSTDNTNQNRDQVNN